MTPSRNMLELLTINGIAQTCFSGRAKGKFLFKVRHPSTEKPKALVGFKPRTEPELGAGDTHSSSTPPPPKICATTILFLLPNCRYNLYDDNFLCDYNFLLS